LILFSFFKELKILIIADFAVKRLNNSLNAKALHLSQLLIDQKFFKNKLILHQALLDFVLYFFFIHYGS
jgi:hypothetical protein